MYRRGIVPRWRVVSEKCVDADNSANRLKTANPFEARWRGYRCNVKVTADSIANHFINSLSHRVITCEDVVTNDVNGLRYSCRALRRCPIYPVLSKTFVLEIVQGIPDLLRAVTTFLPGVVAGWPAVVEHPSLDFDERI